MDGEKLNRIDTFLQEHDQTPETVPPARMEQFKKADAAIEARLQKITEAKDTLKNCDINISAIAADSGISRKTFYNNELLRLYVEKFSRASEETDQLTEIQRLKARIEQYKEQLDAFLIRDVETENLRQENMKLAAEIANLQTRNKNLEERYAVILSENQKLRANLASQPGHIIPIPFSK